MEGDVSELQDSQEFSETIQNNVKSLYEHKFPRAKRQPRTHNHPNNQLKHSIFRGSEAFRSIVRGNCVE